MDKEGASVLQEAKALRGTERRVKEGGYRLRTSKQMLVNTKSKECG